MRLVCSAVSTVLDLLRPLVVAFPSPVQLRITNGRKLTRVASSPMSIADFKQVLIPPAALDLRPAVPTNEARRGAVVRDRFLYRVLYYVVRV